MASSAGVKSSLFTLTAETKEKSPLRLAAMRGFIAGDA